MTAPRTPHTISEWVKASPDISGDAEGKAMLAAADARQERIEDALVALNSSVDRQGKKSIDSFIRDSCGKLLLDFTVDELKVIRALTPDDLKGDARG